MNAYIIVSTVRNRLFEFFNAVNFFGNGIYSIVFVLFYSEFDGFDGSDGSEFDESSMVRELQCGHSTSWKYQLKKRPMKTKQ